MIQKWQEADYKDNLPAKERWQTRSGGSIWNTGDVWVDWKAANKKSLSRQQLKADKTARTGLGVCLFALQCDLKPVAVVKVLEQE
jgi:hypothetical protein